MCWYCVEERRWERVFERNHGAAERAYYSASRNPFEQAVGRRHWMARDGDEIDINECR